MNHNGSDYTFLDLVTKEDDYQPDTRKQQEVRTMSDGRYDELLQRFRMENRQLLNPVFQYELKVSQEMFIGYYYNYLKQSAPIVEQQGVSYDETVFPPEPVNESSYKIKPLKNTLEESVNQQLLLTFLDERSKRSQLNNQKTSKSGSLAYKGLSQTATFLKDYFGPTHNLMQKKKEKIAKQKEKLAKQKKQLEKFNLSGISPEVQPPKRRLAVDSGSDVADEHLEQTKEVVEEHPFAEEDKGEDDVEEIGEVDHDVADPCIDETAEDAVNDPIHDDVLGEQASDQGFEVRDASPHKNSKVVMEIVSKEELQERANEDGEESDSSESFSSDANHHREDDTSDSDAHKRKKKIYKKKEKKKSKKSKREKAIASKKKRVSSSQQRKRTKKNIPTDIVVESSTTIDKAIKKKPKPKTADSIKKVKSESNLDLPLESMVETFAVDVKSLQDELVIDSIVKKSSSQRIVTIDQDKSPSKESQFSNSKGGDGDLFQKIDKLITDISMEKNHKKSLIDLLHLIENRMNQPKLVKYEPLLEFIKEKLSTFDNVMQLFSAKCILKLSFSKSNRDRLLEAGFMSLLVSNLVKQVSSTNVSEDAKSGFSSTMPSTYASKANSKLIRENLKSLHLFCKLGEKTRSIIEDSQLIECLVRLIKHEELKSQKLALKCLCSAIQIHDPVKERFNTLLYKICKLGIIEPLFALLKNSANNVQKDSLHTLYLLSTNEFARDEIYNKGVFHSFLWLIRSENEDIQEYSLKALSHFVPSDNIHVDALMLKYGLDLLVQFFIESFNKNIIRAATKILAHLSEYARIHVMLLQPLVLKQTFSLVVEDDMTVLRTTTFGAHVMLSNLSKFKEGQLEIYKLGGLSFILKSLKQIADMSKMNTLMNGPKERSSEDDDNMLLSERTLLPKVITRTIANLSGCEECQLKLVSEGTLENLTKLIDHTSERTVVWNVLCCLSNLCDQPQNQRKIISKPLVRRALLHFLQQKDDEKLLSRAIRCIAILSKNVHIQHELEEHFPLKTIVDISRDVVHSEIQLDSLRYIANLSHNYEFHDKIIDDGALKVVVKLSYFPLPIFHVEVARCLYNLSQSPKCRSALLNDGAVNSLMRLKSESKLEKVRKYAESALRRMHNVT